jgi:hypothetical protein
MGVRFDGESIYILLDAVRLVMRARIGAQSDNDRQQKSRPRAAFLLEGENYFFSSAGAASAFGASAAGASAAGASAFGASAAGAASAGAASSFLPQAARARASREAISNDFFMIILQVRMKIKLKASLITTGSYRTFSGRPVESALRIAHCRIDKTS